MVRIGSIVNMNFMGWLYFKIEVLLGFVGYIILGIIFMIGGIMCIFLLICVLVFVYLD